MSEKIDFSSFQIKFKEEAAEHVANLNNNLLSLENNSDNEEIIDEIFRIAHTLKGSSRMVGLNEISEISHRMEDLLGEIRTGQRKINSDIVDILFKSADVIEEMINIIGEGNLGDIEYSGILKELGTLLGLKENEVDIQVKKITPKVAASIKKEEPIKKEIIIISEKEESDNISFSKSTIFSDLYESFKQETKDKFKKSKQNLENFLENPKNKDSIKEFLCEMHSISNASAMLKVGEVNLIAHSFKKVFSEVLKFEKELNLDIVKECIDSLSFFVDLPERLFSDTENREVLKQEVISKIENINNLAAIKSPVKLPAASYKEEPLIIKSEVQKIVEEVKKDIIVKEPVKEAKIEKKEVKATIKKETVPKKPGFYKIRQDSTVRINIKKLDELLNLVGELVINKIKFEQKANSIYRLSNLMDEVNSRLDNLKIYLSEVFDFEKFNDIPVVLNEAQNFQARIADELDNMMSDMNQTISQFSILTNNVQESVMKIRMIPVSTVFNKYPRAVRDIAKFQHKKVNFVIEGEETELDKTVIEHISDPLIHLLRNSIDHGIESPETRVLKNKPEEGHITLSAYHEADRVVIRVHDDGRGLDFEKIRNKLEQKGVYSKEEVGRLSKEQLLNCIFLPGFSTKEEVSDISGRGVGLDVVKTNIEKLKGSIEVRSEKGLYTTFVIKLPLTLAIIQALLIKSCYETFVIPLSSIEETYLLPPEDIQYVEKKQVVNIRGEIFTLFPLSDILNLSYKRKIKKKESTIPIVIVRIGDKKGAIVVDKLVGRQEIVIKTLGGLLKKVPNIAGATILGDGQIALILDVFSILNAYFNSGFNDRMLSSFVKKEAGKKRKTILIVDDSATVRTMEKELLELSGFDVEEAEDGLIALNKLTKTRNIDLIITDGDMPNMSGFELIEKVKKSDDLGHIPIFMLTSRSGTVDQKRALDLGVEAYLFKPLEEDLLLKEIEKIF